MTKFDALHSTADGTLARFCADQSGATAVEYALIASGVGAFIAATVFALGSSVKDLFVSIASLMP